MVSPVMVALAVVLSSAAFHSVQLPQAGLVAQVLSAAVQARYCTSKSSMAAPLSAGASHEIRRLLFQTPTVGASGLSGFCAAGVPFADADQALSPSLLVARTCTW